MSIDSVFAFSGFSTPGTSIKALALLLVKAETFRSSSVLCRFSSFSWPSNLSGYWLCLYISFPTCLS
jgi:hypothetical protein